MSVFKRPKSKFYWVRFKGTDGRQIRKSTGETDYDKAVLFEARERKRQTELTFQEAVTDFFTIRSVSLQPKTLDQYRGSLIALDKHFRDSSLSEITVETLKAFVSKRRQKVSDATVKRDLSFLSSVFSHVIVSMPGNWSYNPVRQMSKRHLKEVTRDRWLTPDEYGRLLENCWHPMHKAIVSTAALTGMRSSEIMQLRKGMIDFERNQILLPARMTKSNRPRIIPLRREAVSTLKQVCSEAPDDLVFWHFSADKRRKIPFTTFKTFFNTAKVRAGLEDFRFHDLRHTFPSWWVQEGGDLYALKEILGHASLQMVQRYAHLNSEATHRAMRRLEDK